MGPDRVWQGVDQLLDRIDAEGVRAHDLQPLAARRWRLAGRPVPPDLLHQERATRASMMITPGLLGRARAAYDGAMLVIKGPEVAALYPEAARQFTDIDLLVDDAHRAQRALLAAGFVEIPDPDGEYVGIHHLVPLVWPRLPIEIEIHARPKWPQPLTGPAPEDLFEAAVPSATGVEGLRAPAPHHHALLLAAHAWGHTPLHQARDLIDVAAVAAEGDDAELERAARAWKADRMWRTTRDAYEWLLGGGRPPLAVRLWARHLVELREATVLEGHLERWVSDFWLLPPRAALRRTARSIANDFRPGPGQSWRQKASSLRRAARNASRSKSEHGWVDERPAHDVQRVARD